MIYRTEHPKPQFMRENWQNLNGTWDFCKDFGNSGKARNMHKPNAEFDEKINVPFCMESKLSGIGYTDFCAAVWYKKKINITKEQLNGRIFLHFGACDYETRLYVNGTEAGVHKGGYVSFKFEITDYLKEGENTLTVNAVDDTRSPLTATGKQARTYDSQGCVYTRTTGIWQTVWLEFTPKDYIVKTKYIADTENAAILISADVCGNGKLNCEAFFEGRKVGETTVNAKNGNNNFTLNLTEKHLWDIGRGNLYDLVFTFNGDKVKSYFGLRTCQMDGYKFMLNGRPVFQRTVLDQGFYPDGIYTAPTDDGLRLDIERSMAVGFNGARLHEKVFEERFLYYADKLGYIVWGEFPNWGYDHENHDVIYSFLPEWLEEIERDYNHPSIIGWCPFNETHSPNGNRQWDGLLLNAYLATKAADSTRPVIDSSGWGHVKTDIFDIHTYCQNPEDFKEKLGYFDEKDEFHDWVAEFFNEPIQRYQKGQPLFISEYGGIGWTADNSGWGYGEGPKTLEEFYDRLEGLTDVILSQKKIMGFCYTQLTDVEQEQNGLYTYERKLKFDAERIKKIFTKPAANETDG